MTIVDGSLGSASVVSTRTSKNSITPSLAFFTSGVSVLIFMPGPAGMAQDATGLGTFSTWVCVVSSKFSLNMQSLYLYETHAAIASDGEALVVAETGDINALGLARLHNRRTFGDGSCLSIDKYFNCVVQHGCRGGEAASCSEGCDAKRGCCCRLPEAVEQHHLGRLVLCELVVPLLRMRVAILILCTCGWAHPQLCWTLA